MTHSASVADLEARLTSPFSLYATETKSDGIVAFRRRPKHLGELYSKAARRPDSPFLIVGNETFSLYQLFAAAASLKKELIRRFGVGKGVRVGLVGANSAEWIIAFIAITSAGATGVLFPQLCAAEFCRLCILTTCSLVVASDAQSVKDFERSIPIYCVPTACRLSIADGVSLEWNRCINQADEALLTFTSGTSGPRKAVVSSHRGVTAGMMNMLLSSAIAMGACRERSRPAANSSLPQPMVLGSLAHISGYSQLLLAMMMGGRIVIPPIIETYRIPSLVRASKVTSLIGIGDAAIAELLSVPDAAENLCSIRTWSASGAKLSSATAEKLAQMSPGSLVMRAYGSTETNGSLSATVDDARSDPGNFCGWVPQTAAIEVRDSEGNTQPFNRPGSIWVAGEMLMDGYCAPERGLFGVKNGWFCTGDYGYVSENRELFIQGRESEIIRYCGGQTTSGVLEDLVRGISSVKNACVVPIRKNAICIVVEWERGAVPDVSLLKMVFASSGFGALNGSFVDVKAMPLTPSGKVARNEVREVVLRTSLDLNLLTH